MLYQLSYFRIRENDCGRGWIRTTEDESQQIYSLPHLATLEHARVECETWVSLFAIARLSCRNLILSLLSDSNQRPRDYKSRALAN